MSERKKYIDTIDIIEIKKKAAQLNTVHNGIREHGKAIYIAAYKLFPRQVESITDAEFDCYNYDSCIKPFLKELKTKQKS